MANRAARRIQRITGRRYTECLDEVRRRKPHASALKGAKPNMRMIDCYVEVCFESVDELRARWGDIFDEHQA